MTKFTRLTEWGNWPIVAEPGLEPCERETAIYFSGEDVNQGKARIFSRHPAIIRGLKDLPFFELQEAEAIGNKRLKIVYVEGLIPIGALQIKKPRNRNKLSQVISQVARGRQESPAARLARSG